MIAASFSNKGGIGLLSVDKSEPGDLVLVLDYQDENFSGISLDNFISLNLKAKHGRVYNNYILKIKEEIKVDKNIDGKVE